MAQTERWLIDAGFAERDVDGRLVATDAAAVGTWLEPLRAWPWRRLGGPTAAPKPTRIVAGGGGPDRRGLPRHGSGSRRDPVCRTAWPSQYKAWVARPRSVRPARFTNPPGGTFQAAAGGEHRHPQHSSHHRLRGQNIVRGGSADRAYSPPTQAG
jgi:hypothetical protein